MQRYEWYGFLFGVVAVVVGVLALLAHLRAGKTNRFGDLRVTASSPLGKFSAAVFMEKGDDPTGNGFTLRLKQAGKTFAADSKVFTVASGCEISKVTWKSDKALSVNCVSDDADPCNVKPSYHWRGVTIKTVSKSAVNGSSSAVAERDSK